MKAKYAIQELPIMPFKNWEERYTSFKVKFEGSDDLQSLKIFTKITGNKAIAIAYSIDDGQRIPCNEKSWPNALLQVSQQYDFKSNWKKKEFELFELEDGLFGYTLTHDSDTALKNAYKSGFSITFMSRHDRNGNLIFEEDLFPPVLTFKG